MELKSVAMEIPEDCNLILGQAHFIKTVEDLYEIMIGISSPILLKKKWGGLEAP